MYSFLEYSKKQNVLHFQIIPILLCCPTREPSVTFTIVNFVVFLWTVHLNLNFPNYFACTLSVCMYKLSMNIHNNAFESYISLLTYYTSVHTC